MIKGQKPGSSQEKETIYHDIFNAAPDGIIVNEISTGRVIEANHAAAMMHGYTRDEFIGLPISAVTHSVSRHLFSQYIQIALAGNPFEALAVHLRKDGSSFHVEWHGGIFTYEGEQCLLGTIRDVSLRIDEERVIRKWVEERTHEQATLLEISQAFASEIELKPGFILEQLRGIIEYTHAGLFAVEGSSLMVLTTHNPHELEQAPPLNIRLDAPQTLALLFNRYRPVRIADVNGDDPAAMLLRSFLGNEASALLNEAKSWMWVPLNVKDRIIAAIGLAHSEADFFKAHHADLALTLANQAAITLVNAELFEDAQTLAVLEERQRLAHNLHDAVNQSLFSAGLIAEVLPSLWEKDKEEARHSLEDLRKLTRGAIAEMRMLVAELKPLALSESNLGDLLHQSTESFTGRTGIPVTVTAIGEDTLPPDVQIALYRICQEALNNIAKHAQANQVKISLMYKRDRVEIRIHDNGTGFDPTEGFALPGHYGLGMMNERAEAINATLGIKSKAGKGTEVILRWPETKKQEIT